MWASMVNLTSNFWMGIWYQKNGKTFMSGLQEGLHHWRGEKPCQWQRQIIKQLGKEQRRSFHSSESNWINSSVVSEVYLWFVCILRHKHKQTRAWLANYLLNRKNIGYIIYYYNLNMAEIVIAQLVEHPTCEEVVQGSKQGSAIAG